MLYFRQLHIDHIGFYSFVKLLPKFIVEQVLMKPKCKFKLQCMQTRTGVKFYFITDPAHPATVLKALLQQCYECYVDYVLKNPFHAIDQPIRCEKFDYVIDKLIAAAPQQ